MNLDYKILWFEDQEVWFNEAKQVVKRIVEEHGFTFPEPSRYANSNNWKNINFRDFDLILVDLKLDNETGDSIVEKIRTEEDIYTEIVFYSSDGEAAVRKAVSEKGVDGVFCSARDADKFERKVTKVIETTLKKVQDINNMRGLIMAETSDLDYKMNDIIDLIFSKHPTELQKSLAKKIFDEVASSIKEKNSKFEKWGKSLDLQKLMKDTLMFDASKKIIAIQHIIDSVNHDTLLPFRENKFSESYKIDISENRNIFAHVTVVTDGSKKKLVSRNKEIEFTDDFCIEVREKLKKHSTLLAEIYRLLDT